MLYQLSYAHHGTVFLVYTIPRGSQPLPLLQPKEPGPLRCWDCRGKNWKRFHPPATSKM
jgi:hypothetical protein